MRELFQQGLLREIADTYERRYDQSIELETLADIARIVLHPRAIDLGQSQHGVAWSRDTWLLWIRNRQNDLTRYDWDRTARPFLSVPSRSLPFDQASWRKYLEAYSAELLSFADTFVWYPSLKEHRSINWLGSVPVTGQEFEVRESHLGVRLPDEVKTFYRVTNGWGPLSLSIYGIVPIDEIAPLKEANPGLYEAIAEPLPPPRSKTVSSSLDAQKEHHDQAVRVLRSIVFSQYGGETTILWDPHTVEQEKAWGTWDPDHPGMSWSAATFTELVDKIRSNFRSLRDSE